MDEIYHGKDQWSLASLPPIINSHSHTVLYQLPIDLKSTNPPKPHVGPIKWDSSHVRLPCAEQNEYVFSDEVSFLCLLTPNVWIVFVIIDAQEL